MVNRPVSKKLVYLFALNLVLASSIVLAGYAFSGFTHTAREQFILDQMRAVESRVYALEFEEQNESELQRDVYSAFASIDSVHSRLREYMTSDLVSQGFYAEQEEKLVTLSTLLLKTVKSEFAHKTLVYFYCEPQNHECDYESFVLSYLSDTYAKDLFIVGFDGTSSHPLITMMMKRYEVDSFPFLVINDRVVRGFVRASVLKEIIDEERERASA
ncbi:hypothetical protein COT72_03535 [archaeon CG10_big_fil_rev_8_21_14_0_10_43_11]|nr:MAG: hypothetical protein COT72_03535 [archaeon CG10_big_fil_rev_8_21_14_0_10_43_11]